MLPFPAGARLSPLGNASSRGSRPSALQPPVQSKGQAGQGPPHPAANYPCRPLLDGRRNAWVGAFWKKRLARSPRLSLCPPSKATPRVTRERPPCVPPHGLAGRAAPGPGSGRRSGERGPWWQEGRQNPESLARLGQRPGPPLLGTLSGLEVVLCHAPRSAFLVPYDPPVIHRWSFGSLTATARPSVRIYHNY